LLKGIELSGNDKTYYILFESLGHLMTPNESKSIKYLESVAIPHLKANVKIVALEFCEFLLKHYEKKGTLKQISNMQNIANHIYKDILEGGVFE